MAVHRGTAWFEAPWWTVSVGAPDGSADAGQVQGGSYAEAHALAVKVLATSLGVAESSVTLLLDLVPSPREGD